MDKAFIECEDGTVEQVRVTFSLPASIWADKIYLVGDFNGWDEMSHPLQQDRSGDWHITVDLLPGKAYQFRYLVNGSQWLNDCRADAYVHNMHGTDNFVVVTDPDFGLYFDSALNEKVPSLPTSSRNGHHHARNGHSS